MEDVAAKVDAALAPGRRCNGGLVAGTRFVVVAVVAVDAAATVALLPEAVALLLFP